MLGDMQTNVAFSLWSKRSKGKRKYTLSDKSVSDHQKLEQFVGFLPGSMCKSQLQTPCLPSGPYIYASSTQNKQKLF